MDDYWENRVKKFPTQIQHTCSQK